jgi:hypothetical protein
MEFEIISEITDVETIAVGARIRDIERLRETYGRGRWRKLKGLARVRLLANDETMPVELHWYEATGIGRFEFKVKRPL